MNNVVQFKLMRPETTQILTAEERLRSACVNIAISNKEAQKSTKEYAEVTKTLKKVINELEQSCLNYQRQLKQINTNPLRRKSLRLARMMHEWSEQNPT